MGYKGQVALRWNRSRLPRAIMVSRHTVTAVLVLEGSERTRTGRAIIAEERTSRSGEGMVVG